MNATRLNTQLLLQRSVDFNQNLSAKFLGLTHISRTHALPGSVSRLPCGPIPRPELRRYRAVFPCPGAHPRPPKDKPSGWVCVTRSPTSLACSGVRLPRIFGSVKSITKSLCYGPISNSPVNRI